MPLSPLQIMERLVAFPTVSNESNLELVDFVEDYLLDLGVKPVRVPNDDGSKAAIYAHVGPEVDGGVVLSGHTDVVPTEGQDWTSDPFEVSERDGRLYGRGTCDMKGFNALALSALSLAVDRGIKRPLQIAFSYDEEIGCYGAPPMIEHMRSNGMPRASAVIVGEPSLMRAVSGHKGGIGFQVHLRGHEVHSSIMHEGVSAVMMAAELVSWANRMNAENAARVPGPLASQFVPPYTTIHVGTISGGTAHNITAKDCRFEIDFRILPGEDHADWRARFLAEVANLEAQMKSVHVDTGIDAVQDFSLEGLAPETRGEAEELVLRLTGEKNAAVVSYATEGGLFQSRGYSTIICGPGDIAQAHQPDEFISVEQFAKGEAFMHRLIDALST